MARLFDILFPRPKPEREHQEDLKQLGKGLVTRYARGNVRLQQGKYMTRTDMDKLRGDALRHKF